jgi:uncharacterized membrane protein
MTVVRRALLGLLSAFFVTAGVSHFTNPGFFSNIVPPFLPWPLGLVYVSGVAEIALGLAVLVPSLRTAAGWGLVALLVAVFPANVYHAVAQKPFVDAPTWMPPATPLGLWLRLPVQPLLAAWAWWCTRP